MLLPLTSKNTTSALQPSLYVTYVAASTEASPFHVTPKCVKISSTLLDNISPINEYKAKSSSTRDVADQRRGYIRVGADWRKKVMFSSESYGKARLIPSSTSDLEMLTRMPTSMSQWRSSWIVGKNKRRIITLSTTTSIRNVFLHLCSQWIACLVSRL